MRRALALVVSIPLRGAPAMADYTDTSWKLLIQSKRGTVSLLKNLTKQECEFSRARMLGNPATDEEKSAAKTRDDEEYNRTAAWAAEHHCHGWGATSSESFVSEDGTCFAGSDLQGGWSIQRVENSDIKSAECFQ